MDREQAVAAMQVCGYMKSQITDDMADQFIVFMEAMEVYVDREQTHSALWKQYGAADTAFHLKSKALRVVNNPTAETIDDAIDAINYATFTVRNVRDGRLA